MESVYKKIKLAYLSIKDRTKILNTLKGEQYVARIQDKHGSVILRAYPGKTNILVEEEEDGSERVRHGDVVNVIGKQGKYRLVENKACIGWINRKHLAKITDKV